MILRTMILIGIVATTTLFAVDNKDLPRINGAKIIGARPGNPVLHYVAVSGKEPLEVEVKDLPKGLNFNPKTKLITGEIKQKGNYKVKIFAKNTEGNTSQDFKIKIGEKIQLTPPMGFNSWYCFSEAVSDEKIRGVIDGFVAKKLRDYGWQFVNIDDCWQGERGGKYNAIQPNERFPDMKKLADYAHNKGVKLGIYSSPWICTYAGFIGGSHDNGEEKQFYDAEVKRKQKHQVFGGWPNIDIKNVGREGKTWLFDQDAKQWADWGIDYVKVDWKPNDVPTTKRIYENLRAVPRDIVLSLSNAAPIENAAELKKYAQLWRTTGDIHDSWGSVSTIGFDKNASWANFQEPGAFNDPDMLQIGMIGTANAFNIAYRSSKLTKDEQRTQMSLWALMASPMLVSCDISGMDDFTFSLLCNSDLIDINQDALCLQATPKKIVDDVFLYEKNLENGKKAIGIFNRSNEEKVVEIPFIKGRSIWFEKEVKNGNKIKLAPHACDLFLINNK